MPDIQDELIEFGKNLLRYATGQFNNNGNNDKKPPQLPLEKAQTRQLLTEGEPVPPGSPLQTLFTQLEDQKNGIVKPENPAYFDLLPLTGGKEIFPKKQRPNFTSAQLKKHWDDFAAEERKPDPLNLNGEKGKAESFEAFCYRLRRYAWCLPAPYGGGNVSLYEYFKLVASLRYCELGGEELVVVSGDIAGIQNWLYTIQSSKATQTLRGRSFYLQLISDGIARRLLHRFKLPRTNLIYQGGGNFSLLLPKKLDGKPAEEVLKKEKAKLEEILWADYKGDLSLSLAWQITNVPTFLEPAKNQDLYNKLSQKLLHNRATRFTNLAHETLFKPVTKGWEDIPTNESDEARDKRLTKPNSPYLDLARELNEANKNENKEQAWLVITPIDEIPDNYSTETYSDYDIDEDELWFTKLQSLTEHRYEFVTNSQKLPVQGYHYAINSTTNIFKRGGSGFIFIGNVIPRINDSDVAEYDQQVAKLSVEEQNQAIKKRPRANHDIRDFGQMAKSAHGIQRYGVLRMDVDNLGKKIFRSWLPVQPGPLARATMSSLLGLFFEGYINHICREINEKAQKERGDTLYVIYSGGDDLFVVGAWDRLPDLAVRIREEFKLYTCNSSVTISGGISVADSPSYPLYQAAEDAKKAEDQAKHRDDNKKDAVSFLGVPLDWEKFKKVEEECQELVDLTQLNEENASKAPRALLTNLLDLERQTRYRATSTSQTALPQTRQLDSGRWFWRAAYNLKRTTQRVSERENPQLHYQLEDLTARVLSNEGLPLIGLAARWTHLLTRTSQEED